MQPKAVKVWEALKYYTEKGVDIMSDLDDIPGLHAYIAENEGTKKNIMHQASIQEKTESNHRAAGHPRVPLSCR